jgi:hypothetical protein
VTGIVALRDGAGGKRLFLRLPPTARFAKLRKKFQPNPNLMNPLHLPRRLVSFGLALFALLHLVPASAADTPQIATEFDFSSDTTPGARKFYFATVPGHRYSLWRSTDLQNWAIVPGYPQTATGLSMEHTFAQGEKEFFRVEPIDDQAPTVVGIFSSSDRRQPSGPGSGSADPPLPWRPGIRLPLALRKRTIRRRGISIP